MLIFVVLLIIKKIKIMNEIKNNKLINEYMASKKVETRHNNYHNSWDELMPVIGKISNECEEPEELDGLKYALLCNDIDTAYSFVVDYLVD